MHMYAHVPCGACMHMCMCPSLLSTRQSATAFNQPLAFDTSSVKTMESMFRVRSAHALPQSLHSRAFSPRMPLVRCRRPTPSRLPAHTSLRIVRPPFDSAGRVGVQPAAELSVRHVQRHGHELHVLCARSLRVCPAPIPGSSRSLPERAASAAAIHTLPPSDPHLDPTRICALPSTLGSWRMRSTSR